MKPILFSVGAKRSASRFPGVWPRLGGAVISAAVGVFSTGDAGAAQTAKAALAPAGAITIDGKFDESLYSTARWQSYAPANEADGKASRFTLLFDDSYLYVSAAVTTPDGEIIAKETERDGALSKDDSVEVFIQCGADPTEAFQFIVNALGAVADYQLVQGGLLGAKGYHADLRVATQATADGWQFEMAIPLAQVGMDATRKSWGLQMATNEAGREGKAGRFYSWSPVAHSLRELERFGTLELPADVNFRRFAWRLHCDPAVIVSREGRFFLRSSVEVGNDTDHYQVVDLTLEVPGLPEPAQGRIALASGKHSKLVLEAPLGETASLSGHLLYRLSEQGAGSGLLKQMSTSVELRYTPWELRWSAPGYRRTIFATQKLKQLQARLLRTDPEVSANDLKGELVSNDGKTYPATFTEAGEHAWEISVADIASLPEGTHRFVLSIGKEEEKVLEHEITKLPYQEGEVWIDALGVVRREGIAIPFYGYCFGAWETLVEDWLPGFQPNIAGPVASWGEGEARFDYQFQAMAHLKSLGIYSLIDIPTAVAAWRAGGARRRAYPLLPLQEAEREEYRSSIARLKGNPQVLAYYLADEPELHQHTPRRLGEVAEIYREGDPYKPILIVNNTYNGLVDFLPTSDISMPDRYPIFRKGSGSSSSIAAIEAHLHVVPLGEDSFRARWAVLQGFDYSYYNIPNGRGPTAREMRSQQVSALIGGATGITWYSLANIHDLPGVQSSLPYLQREFRWVFETRQQVLPRAITINAGLQSALLEGAEGPLLLVVNPTWEEREAHLQDPAIATSGQWRQVGTGSLVDARKGKLSLTLAPHESAILVPASMEIPDLDWLAVEQAEARLIAESVVEGNIAHSSHGTVAVAFPETAKWPHTAMAVIDGMKGPRANGYSPRPFKIGEGVELQFAKAGKPKKMIIYGTNITKGRIEIADGENWKPAGAYERPWSGEPVEVALSGDETQKLRMIAEEIDFRFLPHQAKIVEIEVYE